MKTSTTQAFCAPFAFELHNIMRQCSLSMWLLLCLAGAQANLLVNPSFEYNSVAAEAFLLAPSASVHGWNAIGSPYIGLWNNGHVGAPGASPVYAHHGVNMLELDVGNTIYDGIYQTVATEPGKDYRLSFYMRVRNSADAATPKEAVVVEWNDVFIAEYNAYAGAWEIKETVVKGTGNDKLTFRESQNAATNGQGPLLDMVELVALSESPSVYPTEAPTQAPSQAPSQTPTQAPSQTPTQTPSKAPSQTPTQAPSQTTTQSPSQTPTQTPTGSPTNSVVLPMEGGGGGDPHFKTWTGLRYDNHGECDLVFLQNPYFDHGRGLYIHIRTVRKGYYSYIERAALQVGDDRLVFAGMNEWYNNGVKASTKPQQRFGKYKLRVHTKAVSIRVDEKNKIKIDFAQRRNGFLYLVVDGRTTDVFKGSLGMIGQWGSGQMVARDGATVLSDPDAMAQEWQVRGTDPQLFRVDREPQYPVSCRPPKKMLGDRLGSSMMRRRAENVCKSRPVEEESECIIDVMATRDINAAAY